ncbi:hypothetical protein I350_04988 [Cryptococcus amylolentus CBS 6273]|uniref:Uncharacterized protein n=1 Tax=Cryptococcus amylolentus CBS 6273 TaxID=1296118 RepID=A0A1E3K0B5_9TREE|nr:hypothetical protein I350_04988 [Cryptococcus amylolentus CBS 6273]
MYCCPFCKQQLDPSPSEWPDTLKAYMKAEIATEVAKQLREERRHVVAEEEDGPHRWISGVAGVRGRTYRSGRHSKAFATISGIRISFVVDFLILALLPSVLSISFFFDFLTVSS